MSTLLGILGVLAVFFGALVVIYLAYVWFSFRVKVFRAEKHPYLHRFQQILYLRDTRARDYELVLALRKIEEEREKWRTELEGRERELNLKRRHRERELESFDKLFTN